MPHTVLQEDCAELLLVLRPEANSPPRPDPGPRPAAQTAADDGSSLLRWGRHSDIQASVARVRAAQAGPCQTPTVHLRIRQPGRSPFDIHCTPDAHRYFCRYRFIHGHWESPCMVLQKPQHNSYVMVFHHFKGPCMVWMPMYARVPSSFGNYGVRTELKWRMGGVTPYSEIIVRDEPHIKTSPLWFQNEEWPPLLHLRRRGSLPKHKLEREPSFLFNKGGHTLFWNHSERWTTYILPGQMIGFPTMISEWGVTPLSLKH